MEFEPITKENISKVLEYNRIDSNLYRVYDDFLACYYLTDNENNFLVNNFDFKHPFWLELVEVYFGKLKPLPAFDFKRYLLDNGWQISNGILLEYNGNPYVNIPIKRLCYAPRTIKFNKENADRLITMAKIEAELESDDETI